MGAGVEDTGAGGPLSAPAPALIQRLRSVLGEITRRFVAASRELAAVERAVEDSEVAKAKARGPSPGWAGR